MPDPIKIGISACLLGQKVRYDGQDAHARHLTGVFGNHFEYHPVCPEVGCGMGIPREAVRLVGTLENHRLVGRQTGRDWTDAMRDWAEGIWPELEKKRLCGFIFKAKSPSSGFSRIKIYPESGGQPNSYAGVGLFAGMVMNTVPAHARRGRRTAARRGPAVQLHRARVRGIPLEPDARPAPDHEEPCRLPYAPQDAHPRPRRERIPGIGQDRRRGGPGRPERTFRKYHQGLATALSLKPTTRKNVDVLMHILGYFKKILTPDEKRECLEIIENYRNELIPLIVPITLINHYVRKHGVEYLRDPVLSQSAPTGPEAAQPRMMSGKISSLRGNGAHGFQLQPDALEIAAGFEPGLEQFAIAEDHRMRAAVSRLIQKPGRLIGIMLGRGQAGEQVEAQLVHGKSQGHGLAQRQHDVLISGGP